MFRKVGVQQIPAGCGCACAAGLPRAESWHSFGSRADIMLRTAQSEM